MKKQLLKFWYKICKSVKQLNIDKAFSLCVS
jgi:hypothetical protein